MFWRNQSDEFQLRLDLPSFTRTLLAINTKVGVDVSLAVFRSPPRTSRRRERDRHPDFAEVFPVAAQRRRVREINPIQEKIRPGVRRRKPE